ncbi:type I methionyl aminopeptidase [Candidatus Saccharibacteria bacterium CG_4_10_14_0_2_um_filter_52_9]|nr:MAG: type I methionyl aminopeptidase [Candidatus Saccharibacteria bacterium CG_4_10_14_0_2_um_filter_52_9]
MVTRAKTASEIAAMGEGGQMLASVLQTLRQRLEPGMSTKDLADIAAAELKPLGGEPAFKGYQGFPDVICISVNDEVVHGIPCADKIIKDGDIVGLDFGVLWKGMITDAAISVIAGRAKQKGHVELVANTEAAMLAGIAAVHDKVRTGDIGFAVQDSLKTHSYGIVRDLVGHGVGHELHEDPNIPNYGRADTGPWLEKNMTIAIEPMITLGSEKVYIAKDGWTVLTADGSWSAHFEHTVLITSDGAEILTSLSA